MVPSYSARDASAYPHAGGPHHTALLIENLEGCEVEIVTD